MTEDRKEQELNTSTTCEWVRGLDSDGNSIKISKSNLFQWVFVERSHFEGDADELLTPGMYYTNGNTLNANNNVGLFVVLRSMESVTQLGFNVFSGAFSYRTLLYNNNKWDKWTTWRTI